jgi:hypothetical protein
VAACPLIFENLQLTGSDLTLPDVTLRIGNPTETIYVSAAREFSGGQVATESRVGIFGDQSVLDVPFSVHSYTGTFLQNQQALTLTDLLDSDASVVSDPSSSKASPWNDTFQSRAFLNTIWKNAPDGIPGNDDLGEMSSWAVFAMMGFYPKFPAALNSSSAARSLPASPYIAPMETCTSSRRQPRQILLTCRQSRSMASRARRPGSHESFALKGGTLEFDLGNTPNKSWGTRPGDEPPSFGAN